MVRLEWEAKINEMEEELQAITERLVIGTEGWVTEPNGMNYPRL